MKVADAIAHILKAEGTKFLFAYPVNPIIEAAAKVGIRPIIVRQERIGLHMADALSRVSSGTRLGVFCMQYGPGAENALGRAARPLRGAGRALRAGVGGAAGAGGAARSAGHHQPERQERVPRRPPAVAWLGRSLAAPAGASISARGRPDLRHRLQPQPHEL